MNSSTTAQDPPSEMDPLHVEDLMGQYFPPCHPEDHNWTNIHNGTSLKRKDVRELLAHIADEAKVFVATGDGVAGLYSQSQAEEILASYILRSQIRVANRNFTRLLLVELNGVAAVWSQTEGLPVSSSEA